MAGTDIAIAHKDYDVRGGGEILAEELARTFDAPLYVGHGDPGNQPEGDDLDVREIAPESRWHSLMARTGALRSIGHMFHWRDRAPETLGEYDTIITSGNEPLWMPTRDRQTVVAYTHSTPRWMYDLYHDVDGFVGRTYNQLQRRMYEGRVKDPDLWVCNSDLVARRVRKYWDIRPEKVRVVYPPTRTHEYDPNAATTENYFLYLGRLAGHKRVDLVLDAMRNVQAPVIIAGDGPERDRLESMAGPTVSFEGFVDEERKRELLAGAKALLYPPMNEDFGMVPIEAMASGTPVIGVNEGFTRYQVLEGKNGYLAASSPPEFRNAVARFMREGVGWTEREIAAFADRFGVDQFRAGMRDAIEAAQERAAVDVPWDTEGPVSDPDAQTAADLLADGRGKDA